MFSSVKKKSNTHITGHNSAHKPDCSNNKVSFSSLSQAEDFLNNIVNNEVASESKRNIVRPMESKSMIMIERCTLSGRDDEEHRSRSIHKYSTEFPAW